jgi:two-component system, chemotaxis family, response regulator Rcp1
MPVRVLLVEDNQGDRRLTQEAFLGTNNSIQLLLVSDGMEAIAFLQHEGAYVHAPRPDIILLDLNLPKMDGRALLAQIKADDELKTIPTVVVTSSEADSDVINSYKLHANSYVTKPMHLSDFHRLVKSINDFWLASAKGMPSPTAPY